MVWCFGFVVIVALVIYAGFLSRLLPHQVTEIYASVMDPAGGIVGVSVAAVLLTAALWWFASRILVADTSAGLIWRLRARSPEPADLAEQQLVSNVEELALAADTPEVAWSEHADHSSWLIVAVVVGIAGGILLLLLA